MSDVVDKQSRGRILVTGGAGFIGSHTVVDLIENGFEPVIVDDFSNSIVEWSRLAGICGRPVSCYEIDCGDRVRLQHVSNLRVRSMA